MQGFCFVLFIPLIAVWQMLEAEEKLKRNKYNIFHVAIGVVNFREDFQHKTEHKTTIYAIKKYCTF